MPPPPSIILASTSPYRRLLLTRLGVPFTVEVPGIEETHFEHEQPPARALRLAAAKAQAIAAKQPSAAVIGSDQVASSGDTILDKPGHSTAARLQLGKLSGAIACFHTACAVTCPERGFTATHLDTTRVAFRALTPAEIDRYIDREQPLDCAGSFKAEALGISLLERIESEDPTALIGLPLIWLAATMRQLGYLVP